MAQRDFVITADTSWTAEAFPDVQVDFGDGIRYLAHPAKDSVDILLKHVWERIEAGDADSEDLVREMLRALLYPEDIDAVFERWLDQDDEAISFYSILDVLKRVNKHYQAAKQDAIRRLQDDDDEPAVPARRRPQDRQPAKSTATKPKPKTARAKAPARAAVVTGKPKPKTGQ